MVKDVGNILDAGQRARVLALSKTARQLDGVFLRLASGLKINSSLDNPNAFFLSRALTQRADDLARLLDGIGQGIRTIQVADEGVKASLKVLDLAESYLRDVEQKYLSGQVGFQTGLAPNETLVTFNNSADFITYVAGQDVPASGTVTVTGNNEVELQGNFWKRLALNYNVTADTTLIFEYRSTVQPEISAIGFDNDMNFGNDDDRFFLYGSQTSGINFSAPTPTYEYTGSGAWQQIEIPIGSFFTGSFTHLTFIHDDDLGPFGDASFRNIILREGPDQNLALGEGFEAEYAKIVSQLDSISIDAHYRGVNLLRSDDLTTQFNEDASSRLITQGINASREGLGLEIENFNSLEAVQLKLEQVRAAREKLRNYGATLSSDLNVIRIRNELTNGLINTHRAGAQDLVVADTNEEGANMIALQTRQQIQVSILSLRPPSILSVLT
ncbi:MAG: hypothetical protein J0L77_09835 [Alphaproteobacteria bacterium]|nr:hypothetical protein [Alphaproteobacteria bacterium]